MLGCLQVVFGLRNPVPGVVPHEPVEFFHMFHRFVNESERHLAPLRTAVFVSKVQDGDGLLFPVVYVDLI